MGVDVQLYVEGPVSGELLRQATTFISARMPLDGWGDGKQILGRDEYHEDRVEYCTLSRYYGPGYERGSWPNIYGAIRCMQAAFPGMAVFYGSDSYDEGIECTEDYLASIWAHYLGDQGNAYFEYFQSQAASL